MKTAFRHDRRDHAHARAHRVEQVARHLDLGLGGESGFDLASRIRASRNVPIIMITGHTEKHRVEEARDAGVTEFLAKPIPAHSLFSRIAEIVASQDAAALRVATS